ncbi:MAG: DUF3014 domain-containing protein [Acidobacteria bacterium]|nr:DUF3014 domain-containing protein [Acidobacteriota bacterium]
MSVDDLELDRDGVSPPPPPPVEAPSHTKWIVAAIVAVAVIAGFTRWWTLREPPVAEPVAEAPAAPAPVVEPPAVLLPPLDEMDPFLRTLLGALSARPELARWLATDNLIRQMAAMIDRVSQGASPARDLKVLAPNEGVTTEGRGRTRTISEASYRRYDGIVATVTSMDAAAVATAYRTIRPRLNEAYTAMGRADTDVDVAVRRALDLLIATPIPDGPVTIVEGKGATWAYADPALESLQPAQKQLLRLGPANAARVVTLLTAVREQIGS